MLRAGTWGLPSGFEGIIQPASGVVRPGRLVFAGEGEAGPADEQMRGRGPVVFRAGGGRHPGSVGQGEEQILAQSHNKIPPGADHQLQEE